MGTAVNQCPMSGMVYDIKSCLIFLDWSILIPVVSHMSTCHPPQWLFFTCNGKFQYVPSLSWLRETGPYHFSADVRIAACMTVERAEAFPQALFGLTPGNTVLPMVSFFVSLTATSVTRCYPVVIETRF